LVKVTFSFVLRQGLSSLLIGYRTERSDNLSLLQPINKLERPCRTTNENVLLLCTGRVQQTQQLPTVERYLW